MRVQVSKEVGEEGEFINNFNGAARKIVIRQNAGAAPDEPASLAMRQTILQEIPDRPVEG